MRFQYTEKKISLPESVHKYAEKKVMKLERFFGNDADALIAFSIERNLNNVELTVHAANTYFRASESTADMYASIDACVATIERQIRKNKTRLARRLRPERL
jgi:putative sigma-54 modulation protein